MNKVFKFIAYHSKLILIISLALLIPALYGFINTRINYDILVYLPKDIETIKGQNILTKDFGIGSYAFVMTNDKSQKNILELEQKIKDIKGVNGVASVVDVLDTTIPHEMLPDEIGDKIYKDGETVILVTYKDSTSTENTIKAVEKTRKVVRDANQVSSMTSMVIDTKNISDQELFTYVVIAVIFCLIILLIATDSYIIPVLLLSNIGVAILYNMGSNLFLGEISYITKAITAILQLGVTTDFSIFLYHKYEHAKEKYKDKREAMAQAIKMTFKSVIGSSLTTFAGFLALCTMDLTLGTDIGIVMAKGVMCGLLCVLTLFPALLLVFDKIIDKTKHRSFAPHFKRVQQFSIKRYIFIIIAFIVLMVPAFIGNSNYDVYYKLDESLPKDLPFHVANTKLAKKFNIVSPEIILIDKDMKTDKVESLVEDLKDVEGIDLVLAPSTMDSDIEDLLPEDLTKRLTSKDYQMVIMNSSYEIASNKLNKQVVDIDKIVKKYDKKGIIAGEGPLMKDLVTIADHDFKMVNYTSIAVIFVIMLIVLQSFGLPIILIFTIEFAIFMNMACAYFTGTKLPFIASIIVGTIQLGATIDYAILMSTKYLEERVRFKDKIKAIKETLRLTVPSIITSALCFFAATIGVAIYTKIDMIGAICSLLARGSIISMLVVILILPSLLIVFDKFILKTTRIKEVNQYEED
ncbi:MAG: MMPL family transporter [Bacilli bacterium]|nr:MMPL family transporter [Bacilli bacterium]MBR3049143.1 MMPL family transporter [Bacilli bacterium]